MKKNIRKSLLLNFISLFLLEKVYTMDVSSSDIFYDFNQGRNYTLEQLCSDSSPSDITAAITTGLSDAGNLLVFSIGAITLINIGLKIGKAYLFSQTSPSDRKLESIIPSTMDKAAGKYLIQLNEALSSISCFYQHRSSKEAYCVKIPIYGQFKSTTFYRRSRTKTYLYGYEYKAPSWNVIIRKYFDTKPPEEIKDLSKFFKINEEILSQGVCQEPIFTPFEIPQRTEGTSDIEMGLNLSPFFPFVSINSEIFYGNPLSPDKLASFVKIFLGSVDNKAYHSHLTELKRLAESLKILMQLREKDTNIQAAYIKVENNYVRSVSHNIYFLFPSNQNQAKNEYSILLHMQVTTNRSRNTEQDFQDDELSRNLSLSNQREEEEPEIGANNDRSPNSSPESLKRQFSKGKERKKVTTVMPTLDYSEEFNQESLEKTHLMRTNRQNCAHFRRT